MNAPLDNSNITSSKLESDAHKFLTETVGIPEDKRIPWHCLSCLLS